MSNRLIRRDLESQTRSQELLFNKLSEGPEGTVAQLSEPDEIEILYCEAPSSEEREAKQITQKKGTNRIKTGKYKKRTIAKWSQRPSRGLRIPRNLVSLRKIADTTSLMDLVLFTMMIMGSWIWGFGKKLLGKIRSNLQNWNYGARANGEPKTRMHEQGLTEEIIMQLELAQVVWEVLSEEESNMEVVSNNEAQPLPNNIRRDLEVTLEDNIY